MAPAGVDGKLLANLRHAVRVDVRIDDGLVLRGLEKKKTWATKTREHLATNACVAGKYLLRWIAFLTANDTCRITPP